MKRAITLGIVTILLYILQVTVLNSIGFIHVTPNLLIIFVVTIALLRGNKEGAILGFYCGFLLDIFFSNMIGVYSLLYTYIGYLCGYLHHVFYKESIVIPLVVIGVVDFILNFILYIFTFMLRGKLDFNYYLLNIIIPEVIFTLFMAFIINRPLIWLNNKLEIDQEEEV